MVSGNVKLAAGVDLGLALAAAKVSAQWENIGGLANGLLEVRKHVTSARWTAVVSAGVAVPLDRSIPAADCFPVPAGGDSMVLSYGSDSSCWDRSAYRRAALHRGAWDMWMWTPDWVTAVTTARLETHRDRMQIAIDAGLGIAFSLTDAHEGTPVIAQLASEVAYPVSRRWALGLRAMAAGVKYDDHSPVILSVEPNVTFKDAVVQLRLGLMLPLADLGNAAVSPGLGGYKITEQVSIGAAVSASY